MLVKYTELAVASGKLGGTVHFRGRTAQTVRQRVHPKNPHSEYQYTVRGILASLSSSWLGILSEAQREGWEEWAANSPRKNRIGATYHMTGIQAFVRANAVRAQAGLAVLPTAPSTYGDGAGITGTSITVGNVGSGAGAFLDITVTNSYAATPPTGTLVVAWMSEILKPTINYFKGPFLFAPNRAATSETNAPTNPANSPYPLTANGVAAPAGTDATGVIYIRERVLYTDGRMSGAFVSRVPLVLPS